MDSCLLLTRTGVKKTENTLLMYIYTIDNDTNVGLLLKHGDLIGAYYTGPHGHIKAERSQMLTSEYKKLIKKQSKQLEALRPREKALLLFTGNTKSNHSTNQYKVKFTRSHFYVKKPSYKFTICLQNVSKNRKIICKTGCPLTLLLENKSIHHFYSNISLKDVREAHLFQTEF